ncbi:acyl-CoA carboxylase subunit epsilon [Microbacterium sp. No. 7]|uniref:acyl-CoA carboxylase subunit epsilon n=1 Tax=Microbacterium sp. No. 7 TaxID=1714373 RepID=UPI0006D1FCFC|nr:acyl-CoA carboxylase subunit epsilon [Microbacterium sp. No. 7]ALJ19366.1 hypothetical protein AOA12_05385 [Microbacterium sp. No. 7]
MSGPANGPDSVPDTEPAPRVEVLRGAATPEEIAAVIAVVSEAYRVEEAGAVAEDTAGRSAWEVSARALRRPLRRELGWRGFTG